MKESMKATEPMTTIVILSWSIIAIGIIAAIFLHIYTLCCSIKQIRKRKRQIAIDRWMRNYEIFGFYDYKHEKELIKLN